MPTDIHVFVRAFLLIVTRLSWRPVSKFDFIFCACLFCIKKSGLGFGKMYLIAGLNNTGVFHLHSGNYGGAAGFFENALRRLSSQNAIHDNYNNTNIHNHSNQEMRDHAANSLTTESNGNDQPEMAGTIASPCIIYFSVQNRIADEEFVTDEQQQAIAACSLSLSTELDDHCSSSAVERNGVIVDIGKLEVEMTRLDLELRTMNQQHQKKAEVGGNQVLLRTLLSSVVLFNIALTNHLDGMSENSSQKLERASRMYQRVRILLALLNLPETTAHYTDRVWQRNEHHCLAAASTMIDLLYMASWNNEGCVAHAQADFQRSHYCSKNLHAATFFFVLPTPPQLRSAPSEEDDDGDASNQIQYIREFQDAIDVENKVLSFLFNAVCYQSIVTAPLA